MQDQQVQDTTNPSEQTTAKPKQLTDEERYALRITQVQELIVAHADAACEYCLPEGDDPFTKHGLHPAETLPDGSRVHRISHVGSWEPANKSIPCRTSTVKPASGQFTYTWTGKFQKAQPAEQSIQSI